MKMVKVDASPRRSARDGAPAQGLIEFVLVSSMFLMLVIALMDFSVIAFRTATVDYKVNHLEQELPQGWDGGQAAATIARAIAEDTTLDASKVKMENVKVSSRRVSEVEESDEASRFGALLDTHTYVVYTISGDVTYPTGDGMAIAGGAVYTRHFERTLRVENREEIS